MSTRCQIRIEGLKPIIYRHCDGYPGCIDGSEYGVLADIHPFLVKFMAERGWDPEYMLARLTQKLGDIWPDSMLSIGVGMDLHGDIEYLYTIKKNRTIEVRSCNFWDKAIMKNSKVIGSFKF